MGEVRVPAAALWQAQTQRAVENFPISGTPIEPALVHALGEVGGFGGCNDLVPVERVDREADRVRDHEADHEDQQSLSGQAVRPREPHGAVTGSVKM